MAGYLERRDHLAAKALYSISKKHFSKREHLKFDSKGMAGTMDAGRELVKTKRYEDAVEHFGSMLEETCKKHGELDPACAPIYFEYGNCLLLKAEDDADVFGDSMQKEEGEDNEAEEEGGPAGGSAEEGAASNAEDLEVAWEMLEVARVIYSKQDSPVCEAALAKVYSRLGDLSMETGNFQGSVDDYNKCLAVREKMLPKNNRSVADVHCCLAMAWMYFASSETGKPDQLKDALTHYKAAGSLIHGCLQASRDEPVVEGKGKKRASAEVSPTSTLTGEDSDEAPETVELKSILHDLNEKIVDLTKSIESNLLTKPPKTECGVTQVGFGEPAGGVTKVGFGEPAGAATTVGFGEPAGAVTTVGFGEPAGAVTTVGFGEPAAAASTGSSSAPVPPPMMQVRKKQKVVSA
jgi:tetratricopeptide (TPR) repeat protein